jgi:actin-related protein 7
MQDNSTVVIDLGSRTTRAGLGSVDFPDPYGPRIVVESAVLRREDLTAAVELSEGDQLPFEQRSRLYSYPINRGSIEDMDALEVILREVLYNNAAWSETDDGRAAVLVEPVLQSRSTRESLIQLMFEGFNLSSYFTTDAAVSSLYSIGKTSGIVVDVGYDKVDVSPVLEGMVQAASAVRIAGFAGHFMTESLVKKYGGSYDVAEEKKLEACRRLAKNPVQDSEAATGEDQSEEIVGCIKEHIGDAVSRIGDACIQAGMVSLVSGEREWRKTLTEQIFVCGGGSGFPGLGGLIFDDVMTKSHASYKPGLLSIPDYMPSSTMPGCASWFGGALLANVVAGVDKQVISRADYNEYGPNALYRKFN